MSCITVTYQFKKHQIVVESQSGIELHPLVIGEHFVGAMERATGYKSIRTVKVADNIFEEVLLSPDGRELHCWSYADVVLGGYCNIYIRDDNADVEQPDKES